MDNLEAHGNLIVGTENDSYASGNCMTIQYNGSTKIYTLTNTAATDDPYATIEGQYAYLETGKRYLLHMKFNM